MYKSPQIIMFGDLIIRKEEILMKYGERIKKLGREILVSKKANIEKPIGRADHMMLQAQFLSSDFRPNNIRKKELVFNMRRVNEDAEITLKLLTQRIQSEHKSQSMSLLVDELKRKYKYHIKKVKDNFTLEQN